ncbi:MAG: WD40/YVTN/BNR-like repeat-containing protein, partial [Terriglobia bacterium]
PSNPNLVWVGTGEANIRNDVIDGDGVYLSPDAGHTWRFMGLRDAGQISSIIIDPHDSNVVYVGVLGHAWAPNAMRGVFRTTDGGKTWTKALYVSDSTGVSSLVMQPGNPEVLFAGMWEARRYPWMMIDGGNDSGIYRSTDGGSTWTKLAKGLPDPPLGRIALAIAPSNPKHVYALIGSKQGMLWQSLDMGDTWTKVSDNHALDVRPFYFSKMAVSPADENKVYFLSLFLMESDDGGKTAHPADHGVHVDHHAIWIDPSNANRIAEGTDGGFYVSVDAAKHWQTYHNLPIEQFYQVAAGSDRPYTVCGGLQDNNAWCGPSSNLGGHAVTGRTWYSVAEGDGEYAVPAPSNPNIIYADAQSGYINRLDKKTHLSPFIRPSLPDVSEEKPADLKYRYNWTAPIAVSASDANTVYLGANVLFKSTDGGEHWSAISPDLTRNDKAKQQTSGEPVMHDISGAETYDTILSITIAPTNPNVIWVGTDDGLVQVTQNGGKTWANVTPNIPNAPAWAMVQQVGVSPFDAGAAYVAFDAHKLDDRHPYVYKTENYGQSWQQISTGLPDNSSAIVVREDPNQRGLLVLGTMTGLYYSPDGGGSWSRLKANFPTAPVFDLKFVKRTRDLVVATHGRGIFVLDDIRPLEEITPAIDALDFHLFTPAPGALFHHWSSTEGYPGYTAPNRPDGVIIDYYLKSKLKATPQEKSQHHTP